MNLSVASYSFHGLLARGTMDAYGYLETCRHRFGLRGADIWNGMIPSLDEAPLIKLKEGLAEREMELANLCVDGPHLWEASPAARKKNKALALKWLKAAEFLGAKTIRIDAGGRGKTWSKREFDYIVATYKEYAAFAYNAGFKIGPENHWGTEVVPANMRKLCEAVDHPGFGVLVHFKGTGEEQFARWAMHTHISFETVRKNLEPKLAILRNAGYEGYWSVEHHSGQQEYAEVAIQLAATRDVLLRWDHLG